MIWGPTSTGFNRPRKADLIKEIQQDLLAPDGMGPDAPVYDSPLEEICGVLAAPVAELWEALEKIYNSFDPDQADGAALDNLLAITGLNRLGALKTVGGIWIHGTPGTVVPQGFEVKNNATDARYVTLGDVTIEETVPPGGPIGKVQAAIEAKVTGPLDSPPDTAVTVIAGVDSISPITLSPGRDREEDPEARIRRLASLQVLGKGTLKGIEADLRQLPFVHAVKAMENTKNVIVNGMEPYSVRAVIWPKTNDPEQRKDIAYTLWEHKSGIYMNGQNHAIITSSGVGHDVRWDWAEDVPVYIEVDLTTTQDFPDDGVAQVEEAITNGVNKLQVGDDVRAIYIYSLINSVPGILDAELRMGTAPSPTIDDNIVIANDEARNLKDVIAAII